MHPLAGLRNSGRGPRSRGTVGLAGPSRVQPADQRFVEAERLFEPDPVALAAELAHLCAGDAPVEALLEGPGLAAVMGEQRVDLVTRPVPDRGIVGRPGCLQSEAG